MFKVVPHISVDLPLKIGIILILVFIGLANTFHRRWLPSVFNAIIIPFSQVKRHSFESYSNLTNRFYSFFVFSVSFSYLIFIYIDKFNAPETPFISLFLFILIIYLSKYILHILVYNIYKTGTSTFSMVDYQLGLNMITVLVLLPIAMVDIFYFKLNLEWFFVFYTVLILFQIIQILGSVFLALKDLNLPILLLFVYLCSIEILPALILVKILFN